MYKIVLNGDMGVSVVFEGGINYETAGRVTRLKELILSEKLEGIVSLVPSYAAVAVNYNPLLLSYDELRAYLEKLLLSVSDAKKISRTVDVVHIPVLYGGSYGEDLKTVVEHSGLTEQEVINIHSDKEYLVYMLGFTPGFPYLGGMDKKIATPRLKTPRIKIEAGSVGIAGEQTGIYPIVSPGGWQIIGNTPIKLYDPNSDNPILLTSGNYLKFEPISENEYNEIKAAIEKGEYTVKITEKEVVL